MKNSRGVLLLVFFIIVCGSFAQDTLTPVEREKLELFRLRHEMLDVRIGLLEQRMLQYIESDDRQVKAALDELYHMVWELQDSLRQLEALLTMAPHSPYEIDGRTDDAPDRPVWPEARSVMALHPTGLFRGNFELSAERVISRAWSIELSLMGTYVTRSGLGSRYLKSQEFTVFDELSGGYVPYEGEMFTGFGFMVRAKHFPMQRIDTVRFRAPLGLYASPIAQYRYYDIRGERERWIEGKPVKDDVVRHLNSFGFGVVLGYQFPLFEVLAVDIFAGGIIRLSKYSTESHLTRYKQWNNIDYSGVLPTAGIKVGILR